MVLGLELDAFDAEIEKYFAEEKLLTKALHQFRKKTGLNPQINGLFINPSEFSLF
jgi:hypothetical protein